MSEVNLVEIQEKLEEFIRRYVRSIDPDDVDIRLKPVVFGEAESRRYWQESIPEYKTWIYFEEDHESVLHDAAEWLYDSGNGYELQLSTDDGSQIDDPSKEQVVPYFQRDIQQLAGFAIEYAGDIQFDEEAYEEAFRNHFATNYRPATGYVIAPLLGLNIPENTSFELPTDPDWFTAEYGDGIDFAEVHAITNDEYSSVLTMEERTGGTDAFFTTDWTATLYIEYSEPSRWERIADDLTQILNFFKPRERGTQVEKTYSGSPGLLNYHFGIYDFTRSKGTFERGFRGYDLTEDEIPEFIEFWTDFGEYFGRREGGTAFDKPLRRYHQIYEESRIEDQILDCMIALEASVLKDIGGGYKYHLPIRGTILLRNDDEIDPQFVYQYLDDLYSTRNAIIHQDEDFSPTEISNQVLNNREYIQSGRYILSRILVKYMEKHKEGISVHEWNTEYLMGLSPSDSID
ncbi:MAG: hypothetical protein U5J98_07035 [Halobacteriales archaeon]|nr:hypothetical protein [Halobacteriales archaeon]